MTTVNPGSRLLLEWQDVNLRLRPLPGCRKLVRRGQPVAAAFAS